MHINWLGQTCIKLQTKNLRDEDVVILIDPYKPAKGDFPRSLSPQIALFSQGSDGSITLSQDPYIMDTLGEIEIKDTMIYARPAHKESSQIIFKIISEGITLVHLGNINKKLNTETIAKLDSPDILFVPIGGNKTNSLSVEDVIATITALEPRIIIPIAYYSDTDPDAEKPEEFIKNLGIKPESIEKKFIIKKKDLPQEDTKLYLLEKNY